MLGSCEAGRQDRRRSSAPKSSRTDSSDNAVPRCCETNANQPPFLLPRPGAAASGDARALPPRACRGSRQRTSGRTCSSSTAPSRDRLRRRVHAAGPRRFRARGKLDVEHYRQAHDVGAGVGVVESGATGRAAGWLTALDTSSTIPPTTPDVRHATYRAFWPRLLVLRRRLDPCIDHGWSDGIV